MINKGNKMSTLIKAVRDTTKLFVIAVVIMVISILAIGIICGIIGDTFDSKESKTTNQSQHAVYQEKADTLITFFENNKVAFNIAYGGKVIIVTGEVQNFDVALIGSSISVEIGSNRYNNIHCYFSPCWKYTIARMTKGDFITIKGQVDSNCSLQVTLNNCIIY